MRASMIFVLLAIGCRGAPDAPANLQALPSDTGFVLTWEAPGGTPDAVYEVQVSAAGGPFATLGGLVNAFPPQLLVETDPLLPDLTPLIFRVRTAQGARRSAWSNQVSVVSRRPFLQLEQSPRADGLVAQSPFVVEFRLSLPIDPASITQGASFVDPAGNPLPTTASVERDGQTLRLVLGVPLETAGRVSALASPRDLTGRVAQVTGGPWFAWRLRVFDPPQSGLNHTFTNGSVSLQLPNPVALGPAVPIAGAQVYAGGSTKIADLGAPPWPPIVWDTAQVPEGTYPISVRVPGFADDGHWGDGPIVHVDRTPAHVTCSSSYGAPDQLSLDEVVTVLADEPVIGGAPTLSIDGALQPATFSSNATYGFPATLSSALPRTTPFSAAIGISPGATDLAGNPVLVSGCTFQVPQWLSPWGAGALAATTRATALALGVTASYDGTTTVRSLSLAFIPAAGDAAAGQVLASVRSGLAAPPELVALSSPGATASSVSLSGNLAAWVEQTGSGPGQVQVATWANPTWTRDPAGPFNFNPAHDAAQVVVGASLPHYQGALTVAWSEDDGAGGRAIAARALSTPGWVELPGEVRATAGSVAQMPSLTVNVPGTSAFTNGFLAFLESTASGPAQLRVANAPFFDPAGGWTPEAGSLNADLAASASEPAAWALGDGVVAWSEGGKVLARRRAFGGAAFAAPQVLNANPAHAARSPRLGSNGSELVVFVEAGVQGDEIWARRWDGTQWVLLSGQLNTGDSGAVTALAIGTGLAVGWVDATGAVRVRLGNF